MSSTAVPDGFILVTERAAYLAQVHIGVTTPLLFLALLSFGLRLYLRVIPVWKIGWSDWCMITGFAATLVVYALTLPEMVLTPGLIPEAQDTNASKCSFLAIPVWGIAMTLIKVSVAITLLRIQQTAIMKTVAYTVMALQTIYGVGNVFFILLQCRPLEASWDPVAARTASCLDPAAIRVVSTTGTSINITTDLLLALAPLTFMWQLRRPLREKLVLCFLMGLGLFAAAASLVKTLIVREYGTSADPGALGVAIATWTITEMLLGILAACIPFLNPLLKRCLGYLGIRLESTANKSTGDGVGGGYSRRYRRATGAGGSSFANPHAHVTSQTGGPGNEDEEDLDPLAIRLERRFSIKSDAIRASERQVDGSAGRSVDSRDHSASEGGWSANQPVPHAL